MNAGQIYCRAEGLSVFEDGCWDRAMALTVSPQVITAETRVRSQDNT